MPTLLQLQKKKAEAAAAVDDAKKALAAAKTDAETARATSALAAALSAKAEAGFELAEMGGAPAAKMVTVSHLKHEEKVTQREEEEEGEEEEGGDKPPMRAKDKDDSDDSDSGKDKDDDESSTDSEEEEEEEESKAIAAQYKRASAAIRKSGSLAACNYTPDRLLRAVKKATGARTLKAAFGALASMGERIARADKIEKRIASLETETTAAKVDKLIAGAKKAGKIVGKAHEQDMRAEGLKQGPAWLEGRLANMPRVAQTTESGGFVAAEGSTAPQGAAGLSKDQEKMLSAFTAGMSPEQRAAFVANMAKTTNGAGAPSH